MEKINTTDTMTTSSEVLNRLREKGMDNEFRWTTKGFTSAKNQRVYRPEELEIIKTFRFEGASNPSDMEIVYVLKGEDGTIGYSLDAYGVYSSHEHESGYDNFIRQVPEAGHDEQLLFEL